LLCARNAYTQFRAYLDLLLLVWRQEEKRRDMSRKDIILTLLDALEEMTRIAAHNNVNEPDKIKSAWEIIERYRKEYPHDETR